MAEKRDKKNSILRSIMIIIFAVFVLNFAVNTTRIFIFDKLVNTEIYQYPNTVSIVYNDEKRYSATDTYFVNTYLRKLFVCRVYEKRACEMIDNPKAVLEINGEDFYLSDDNRIVFAVDAHLVEKRSIIDRIIVSLFYHEKECLYYATAPNEDNFKNIIAWYNIFDSYCSD